MYVYTLNDDLIPKSMNDHIDKFFYLIVGIIYIISSYYEKHVSEEPLVEEVTKEEYSPLSSTPDRKVGWDPKPKSATPDWDKKLEVAQPERTETVSKPLIRRKLKRYSGWKKVIVMSETMRPYL